MTMMMVTMIMVVMTMIMIMMIYVLGRVLWLRIVSATASRRAS
jgi:hypothetical protein